jgi:hypothetical protein
MAIGVRAEASLAGGTPTALVGDEAALDVILPGAGAATSPKPGAATPGSVATPGSSAETPWVRPTTLSRPVPAALRPPLAGSRADHPNPQPDGCDGDRATVSAKGCLSGDPAATTTVVLIGDSHALAWFPAVERIAEQRGWRLITLTKSACQPAAVSQWDGTLGRVYDECHQWRDAVADRVRSLRPSLVLVTSSHAFRLASPDGAGPLPGGDLPMTWRDGTVMYLRTLAQAASRVVLLADTPSAGVDVPECISAHMDNILDCATPVEDAIEPGWTDAARSAAAASGASFVDPSPWVCPSDPCPPVVGNFLVYRDKSHMTASFAAALAGRLEEAIGPVGTDRQAP